MKVIATIAPTIKDFHTHMEKLVKTGRYRKYPRRDHRCHLFDIKTGEHLMYVYAKGIKDFRGNPDFSEIYKKPMVGAPWTPYKQRLLVSLTNLLATTGKAKKVVDPRIAKFVKLSEEGWSPSSAAARSGFSLYEYDIILKTSPEYVKALNDYQERLGRSIRYTLKDGRIVTVSSVNQIENKTQIIEEIQGALENGFSWTEATRKYHGLKVMDEPEAIELRNKYSRRKYK